MWIKASDKYADRALELVGMTNCNSSTSLKLDKQHMDGDEEDLKDPGVYRSTMCALLYLAQRRPDTQSTVRWLRRRLMKPNVQSDRQLRKLLRYLKGAKDLATFFPVVHDNMVIEGFVDCDWGCDDLDRKSVSGGVDMVGGCRIHCHSRTTQSHALSSGESEIMSLSELLKDCLYIQFCLEFCGMGTLPICMLTDASVARQFVHRKGVGRMKHIDVCYLCMQEAFDKAVYTVKKIPRTENPSDILTHPPTKNDLEKFMPMIGVYPLGVALGAVEIVKAMVRDRPAMELLVAMMVLMMLAQQAEAARPKIPKKAAELDFGDLYFWTVHLLAMIGLVSLVVWSIWLKRRLGRSPVRRPLAEADTTTRPILVVRHPESVWLTTGDYWYHVDEGCSALAHARTSKKRPCLKRTLR